MSMTSNRNSQPPESNLHFLYLLISASAGAAISAARHSAARVAIPVFAARAQQTLEIEFTERKPFFVRELSPLLKFARIRHSACELDSLLSNLRQLAATDA